MSEKFIKGEEARKLLYKWRDHLIVEHGLSSDCEIMKDLGWFIGEAIDGHVVLGRPKPMDRVQMPTPVKCGYVGCSFTIDVPDFIVSISTKGVEHLTFEIYDHYFEVHDVPRPVEGKKERE